MPQFTQVDERLFAGGQPDADAIQNLAHQGFKTVINLRVENEEQEMLSPVEEGNLVREANMVYLHLPISAQQIRPSQVDDFRDAVSKLEAPVYVHCAGGKRAGALAVMHQAVQQRWDGNRVFDEAQRLGFEFDQPELAAFVKEYVNGKTNPKDSSAPKEDRLTGLQK